MPDRSAPPLSAEEAQAFTRTAARVQASVARQLGDAVGPAAPQALFVGQLQGALDRLLGAAVAEGEPVACRPGCSHCCHARVEAFWPELLAIAELIDAWPADDRQAVFLRLQAHPQGATAGASWSTRPACPLLVDGLCTVYAARPSACRRAHSLDLAACRAGAPLIPQRLKWVVGAAVLTEGTLAAFADQGFDTTAQELVAGLLSALAQPPAQRRWRAGVSPPSAAPSPACP